MSNQITDGILRTGGHVLELGLVTGNAGIEPTPSLSVPFAK